MAFKRKETVIEAIDLNTITPEDAERRIIDGVKKYATNEQNWSKADANTPYLGHIIGMGIESSNLANLTTLAQQAKAYAGQLGDPAALAAARQKTYESDKATLDSLTRELQMAQDKIKGASASNDMARLTSLRAEEAEIKTRQKMAGA